jgi:coproporphyrinogen III oxidase
MEGTTPDLMPIVARLKGLQDEICAGLEALDGKATFQEDLWSRENGGGGRSRVIVDGNVIEKGGVNFSHVHGPLPDRIAEALKLPAGAYFHATGVSIVLHARSPFVPIIHMNVRYFEVEGGRHWFGGGIDVSPIYVVPEQAVKFHQRLKDVCDAHSPDFYPKFKEWCDRYFYQKHRKETRGIGGIFYDHLEADAEHSKEELFAFEIALGQSFVPCYQDFVAANAAKPYGERELNWQAMRRARYVEFNLLWDKGTKFGLDTDGRTESILMSMPPMAKWAYNYQPEPSSPEAATLQALKATDWLGIGAQETKIISGTR